MNHSGDVREGLENGFFCVPILPCPPDPRPTSTGVTALIYNRGLRPVLITPGGWGCDLEAAQAMPGRVESIRQRDPRTAC